MNWAAMLRKPYEYVKELACDDESAKLLARHAKSGEFVGVKWVRLGKNLEHEFHCRKEAETLERIYHPHIVRTYEHWSEGNSFFLVQEFIQGVDLESYAAGLSPLKPRDRIVRLLRVFKDIARAVAALHGSQLVLGRISSQEVLVESSGVPKLAYNALSFDEKNVGRMKRHVALAGTVSAVSPEELKGKDTSFLSDIYALGASMYSIFSGTDLVSVSKYEDVAKTVCSQPPEPPSKFNADIPPELEQIILQALERDPARRTPSMNDVARRLSELLDALKPVGLTTRMVAATPKPGALSGSA